MNNKKRDRNNFEYSNNNNSNSNIEYNIKLYNSVFNNIYIKSFIFKHLNIFNSLQNNIHFESLLEFQDYKYKDYLYDVTFLFVFYDFNLLPNNIKKLHLKINFFVQYDFRRDVQIPDHIESISFSNLNSIYLHSTYIKSIARSTKLTTLKLILDKSGQIEPYSIPQSITSLRSFSNDRVMLKLSINLLPSLLKRLSIKNIFSWENDVTLPESLNELKIIDSDPLLINTIPSSNNLKKLTFSYSKSDIESYIKFPNSLECLDIMCNKLSSSLYLPSGLKSLKLSLLGLSSGFKFPSSLEKLELITFNQYHLLSFPSNLRSLHFQCISITNNYGYSILPQNLEKLVMYPNSEFNNTIHANNLPSSLTYLDLGSSFNQIIDINVLPSNLKTLLLGVSYTKKINPLSIPNKLKTLKIACQLYQHQINLTSTHPYTEIQCHDISLYYQTSNTQVRVLTLPDRFDGPLSELKLQDKSNLEYLNLGRYFNYPIELSELPTNNNIKTLVLSNIFQHTINLDNFPNLETLIIPELYNRNYPIIKSSSLDNNPKLKKIILKSTQYLKQLDENLFPFIKFKLNHRTN